MDRVKFIAGEGALLTMIGKVTYNIETDQFSITDGLGLIGGGFEESLDFLRKELSSLRKIGGTLLISGLTSLALVGVAWLIKEYKAK